MLRRQPHPPRPPPSPPKRRALRTFAAATAATGLVAALGATLGCSGAAAAKLVVPTASGAAPIGDQLRLEVGKWLVELGGGCELVEECYCIKGTTCGWCKADRRARLQRGECEEDDWIQDAERCPTLRCGGRLQWWMTGLMFKRFSVPVVLTVASVLLVWWWFEFERRGRDAQEEMDIASRSVIFQSGQGAVCPGAALPRNFNLFRPPPGSEGFFGTLRTYKAFRKGLDCPTDERLSGAPARKYTDSVQKLLMTEAEAKLGSSRVPPWRFFRTMLLTLRWHSPLMSNLPVILVLMLMSSLFILAFGLSAQLMDESFFRELADMTKENKRIITALECVVATMLFFYSLNQIDRYWSIMRAGWRIQGRAHDLAMISGPALGDSERDWHARYALYRHLMLGFFFCYQPHTPRFQFVGFEPLVECGLLEADEVEPLARAHSSPRTVVEAWLSAWVHLHLTDYNTKEQAMSTLCQYRDALSSINYLVSERAPASFESLLQIAVYLLCFTLPFGPISQLDYRNRQAVVATWHVMIVLSKSTLIAFYICLVHLLRHLQAPFDDLGAPQDCLNPLAIMNTTEKKLRDYLTCAVVSEEEYVEKQLGKEDEKDTGQETAADESDEVFDR